MLRERLKVATGGKRLLLNDAERARSGRRHRAARTLLDCKQLRHAQPAESDSDRQVRRQHPFARQEYQFTRMGLSMHRGTMADWTIRVAERAESLMTMLLKDAKSYDYLQVDETHATILNEDSNDTGANKAKINKRDKEKRKPGSHWGFMWVMRGGPTDPSSSSTIDPREARSMPPYAV